MYAEVLPMPSVLRFDGFTVEPDRRALFHQGKRIATTGKEFDLLLHLARAPARLVTKDELIYGIWPHEGISDANLAQVVYRLRKKLAACDPQREYIATIPGQGYQFTALVAGGQTGMNTITIPDKAFQLYRNGRYLLALRTGPAMQRSIPIFEEALAIEPRFVLAHVSVAEAYAFLAEYLYMAASAAFPQAKAAALQALEIDPNCAEAHAALGEVLMYYERDWGAAAHAYETALAIAPFSITARLLASWHALFRGKVESAIDDLKAALSVDPASVLLNTTLGVMHYYARDYSAAGNQLADILALEPHAVLARHYSALLDATTGEFIRARDKLLAIAPAEYQLQTAGLLGYVSARLGEEESARNRLAFLENPGEGRLTSHMQRAFILTGLGRTDDAVGALELAFVQSDPWLPFLQVHPLLDPLRGNARFRKLLERV